MKKKFITGKKLLIFSVISRSLVLLLLCLLAMWTEYLNLKVGYNNARLVELSAGSDRPIYGKLLRQFYESSDAFFSFFGDPIQVMQSNGGMTWSIRLMGVPFSDPVAGMALIARNHTLPLSFGLGLIIPLTIVLLFGRVFCSYICPASLVFFIAARIRRYLGKFFIFPEFNTSPALAWGILCGGLLCSTLFGYGIWTLILPYFAIGQTIFHGLAFGTLSVTIISLAFFLTFDLILGQQFTCRNLCPTGRLLGFLGQKSKVIIKRDASQCVDSCHSCTQICPLKVDPKKDETRDCSLCGECLSVCPSKCLSVGIRKK
ncbi:4Fe-4S binding protein [Lentisphaera profundi]|uniref:4Fe-4S binding protein n=1 Tax=Lentisphaera profundi TaxID=1658616 RepID=A0ABY7VSQ9_9BACT|nr:4Fe-4S binding protein [Lentisphaera profundi]WDE96250.1 4Fe-4S binding protein [Lentisphaera profundi]